jgi:hypothetical protein
MHKPGYCLRPRASRTSLYVLSPAGGHTPKLWLDDAHPHPTAAPSTLSGVQFRDERYRIPRDALAKLGMSVTLFRYDVFCGIVLHCDTFEEEPPPQP